MKSSITLDIFNDSGAGLGKKRFYTTLDSKESINKWIKQYDDKVVTEIAYMCNPSPDFQHNSQLYISQKKGIEHFNFFKLFKNNLIVGAVYFAVRHCIKATWINDRDQFLNPNKKWEKDTEFQNDCLCFMLFHGQNRIASKEGINHFIPFAELELNAQEAFDSHFMQDFLQGKIKQDSRFFANAQNEVSLENDNLSHRHTDSAPCHTERSEVSKNTESKRDFSFATQTQSEASLENDKRKKIQYDKVKSKPLQTSLFKDELESTFIPTKPLEFS
nr:hypothetical protein [uncultured Helicobacter sp.]